MKRILILLTCIFLACNQKAEQNDAGYFIKGEVTNFKDSTMLYLHNLKLDKEVDSTYLVKGEFSFKGFIEEPQRFILKTKFDPKNLDSFKYTFFWLENTKLNLKADFEDFQYANLSGSRLNDIDRAQILKKSVLNKQRDSIVTLLRSGKSNKTLSKRIKQIDSINKTIDFQFIRSTPNNHVALETLIFLKEEFPKEELNKIYNALDENLKQSDNGKSIKTYLSIDNILEKGDYILDIEGKNLQGHNKTLASIVKHNKYTILDFWAAGCGPCRMQSKQYAKLYKKYHSKGLEIVSFSLDKSQKNWEAASKKDNISWINISDLKGNMAKTPMTYGVRGIPNSFLIDQKGKIVAEFNGYNSKKLPFEKELELFFNKEEVN